MVSCQLFPSPAQYQVQQHHQHPTPHPQVHQQHDYRSHSDSLSQNSQSVVPTFDFDKFNQQAKQLQAQLHYFNQQQQKHIQQQINSVHQDGSEPHFDFAVNGNYTDLEKASEQFVNLGHLVGKQNVAPKVIKITKTVAVKHPVPVPYPVPVVKVVKEQAPFEVTNPGHHGLQYHPTTEKPSSAFDFSNYKKYPTQASSASFHHSTQAPLLTNSYHLQPTQATSTSDSFHRQPTQAPSQSGSYHHHQKAPSSEQFDTEPFYITTPQKETIKIVPVPYYIDDDGNKHEISQSSLSQHDTDSDSFYPNKQSSSSLSQDGSGKFQSFTFSYHPPTPNQHHHSTSHQQQQSHNVPETKYYYNHDSDNSASAPDLTQHYSPEQSADDHQHYQYKYVTYE
jgi:hypothetical protein